MIVEKLNAWHDGQRKVFPCYSNRASELGHECLRYLVFNRTHWDKAQAPSLELQRIFHEGEIQEKALLRDLLDSGVVVLEQQRALAWKKYQITAHPDGKVPICIEDPEQPSYAGWATLEIKSMSPWIWQQITTAADMLYNKKYPHLRKYPAQLQIATLLWNLEFGVFLLKNKQSGEVKEIVVPLDMAFIEELIQKAEKINEYVAHEQIPPPIAWNERLCGSCKFNHLCAEDQKREGLQIIEDTEIVSMLERRAELEKDAEEYDELDKDLKQMFRGKARTMVGDWLIISKKQERKDDKEVWNTSFTKIITPKEEESRDAGGQRADDITE